MPETIIVSYSELDTARQCFHKHDLSYKQRWREPETSPALAKGTLWHAVLEMHYKLLMLWQKQQKSLHVWAPGEEPVVREEIPETVAAALLFNDIGRQTEYQDLITWMYEGYLKYYGWDDDWTVLAVEHAPVVWLPTDRGGRSRFQLKLKIDLVVTDRRGNLLIVDHKSGKDLPKDKELELDDQFGLYTWALRKIGRKVHGSVHSAARTQRNKDQTAHPQPLDERFRRKPMYRTDKELDCIAIEAYETARLAYSASRSGRSTNPDTCRWRCSYTEPCLAGRKGMDEIQFLVDKGFVQDFTRH